MSNIMLKSLKGPFRSTLRKSPRELAINLTKRCDMNCIMCYRKNIKSDVSKELSTSEIKYLLLEAKKIGTKDITFSGGEPLLRKDIFELLKISSSLGLFAHISTNLQHLDKIKAKKLVNSGVKSINVSLDSPNRDTFDKIRGKKGAFDILIKNLKWVNEFRINTDVKVALLAVIMKENLHELPDLIPLAQKLKVDSLNFQAVLPFRGELKSKKIVKMKINKETWDRFWLQKKDLELLDKVIDRLIIEKKRNPIVKTSVKYLKTVKSYFRNPSLKKLGLKCDFADNFIAIDEEGNLLPCWRVNWGVGNVRNSSLSSLLASEKLAGAREIMANCDMPCLLECYGLVENKKRTSTIAVIKSNWLPITERFIFDELDYLDFYEPCIFCVRREDNFRREFGLFHKPIYENLLGKKFPFIRRKQIGLYRDMISQNNKIIKNKNIKLLHAQFMTDALFFLELKRLTKLPMIVSARGCDLYSSKINYLPLFHEAELFLARSETMKKDMIKKGCSPDKIIVHHSGIKLKYNELKDKTYSKNINILMVGRFVEKKGTIFGIKIFNKVCKKYKNVKLNIIGDGPLKSLILKEVKASPFAREIKILREMPNTKVLEFMKHSHILLHPSKTAKDGDKEGIPNSIMESMSLGLIVVASDNGSIPEIIENKKTGFMFREGDHKEAIDKLSYVIENLSELNEIRINAFKKVKDEFNIKKQAKTLELLYGEQILNTPARPSRLLELGE